MLVSCPINNLAFVRQWPDQLAVFLRCSLLTYQFRYARRSRLKNSQLTDGPKGCDENGPAAALLVGYVSIQICALLASGSCRTGGPF
jgi:hypothetical protein